MTALAWDQTGEKTYETGVEKGVLYVPDDSDVYSPGVAWNGLTTLTESPSGADANAQYADNIKYLNLLSAESFGGTIEAFTFPDEFDQFDGLATPQPGVLVAQQTRKHFGLCYKTLKGNDIDSNDFGYKLHLVYGIVVSPSEKAFATVNDTPSPIAFSWAFTTTPVPVSGLKPTSLIVIDSTEVDSSDLTALELILYGSSGVAPVLPKPDAVIALFAGEATGATPTAPTYNNSTHTLTIPSVTGLTYYNNGVLVTAGAHVIAATAIVTAEPNAGYFINPGHVNEWEFDYS